MGRRRGERRADPRSRVHLMLVAVLGLAGPGCWREGSDTVDDPGKLTIALRSPAFGEGALIPREYTCDGAGGSPPLEWSGIPQAAKELVLVVDDPDAPMGTFTHWVVVGLSPRVKGLKSDVRAGADVPAESMVATAEAGSAASALQGKNDFGKLGYGGPCPPSGTHRYVFRLLATDANLEIKGPPTRSAVLVAMKGHILAEGRLIGRYVRSK